MFSFAVKRLLDLLVVLLGVSFIIFMLLRLIPGDAVQIMLGANTEVTQAQIDALRHKLGLDLPLLTGYLDWLGQVLRGNLGHSLWTGVPVRHEILARLPVTLELTLLSLLLTIVVSVPLGIFTAYTRNSFSERLIRFVTIVGITTPSFWLGTLFIYFAFLWFPNWSTIGYVPLTDGSAQHFQRLILPTVALALPMIAGVTRILRSALLDTLDQDYMRTAKAKGVPMQSLMLKHALRNAMIPLVTVLGIQAGALFGGTIVIEQVFAMPGIGRLILGAINERNYALVQGAVLLVTAGFVIVNFIVDLLYAAIDPRVEYD